MKLKLIASVLVLMVALTGVLGATSAMFSDYETSIGNTFTAGKLDLQVNGGDGNVSLFEIGDLTPEDFDFDASVQPNSRLKNSYTVENVGTITGYLNIKGVSVTNYENGYTNPEEKYGDTTSGELEGELGQFLRIIIFIDDNNNQQYDTGETIIVGDHNYSNGYSVDGEIINNLNNANIQERLGTINYQLDPGATAKVVGVLTNWYRDNPSNGGYRDNIA